jgi:exodeoxyribonuclease III
MSFRVFSWNVNGIRSVAKKGFAQFLRDYEPEILCIQEARANPEDLPAELVSPEGYHTYHEVASKKGYSGVSLYSMFQPVSLETSFGNTRFDGEGRIQIAEFESFVLFNLYFPNGKQIEERLDYKLGFCEQLLLELQRFKERKVIICGDYNTAHQPIDLKNPRENEKYSGFLPVEREWIDRLISHGFVDVYRVLQPDTIQYSWWSYRFNCRAKNIGWRIDYHFVSENLLPFVSKPVIHDEVTGSDHCPLSLVVDLPMSQ